MIGCPPIDPGRLVDWHAVKATCAKNFGFQRVRRYNKCPSTCPSRVNLRHSQPYPEWRLLGKERTKTAR